MSHIQVATNKRIIRVSLRQSGISETVTTPKIVRVNATRLKVVQIARRGLPGSPGSGGGGGISNVVEDLTPQLGGNLDLNGNQILGQLETAQLVLDGGLL